MEVNLFGGFTHLDRDNGHFSMTDNRIPKNWKWVRNKMKHNGITIFSDDWMCNGELVTSVESTYKVGMIIEPPQINSNVYSNIETIIDLFDFILTYNRDLIDKYPTKCIYYPFGGSWVLEDNIGVYEKSKDVNIIYSNKKLTDGHKLRHEIARMFPDVDRYGSGAGIDFDYKEEILAPYRFSIVVENSKIPDYFSEKLLDCFAVGTIPIYYGPNAIGNYFDKNGIIMFDTISELDDILSTLTTDLYERKLHSVMKNNAMMRNYYCQEDWIYDNVFKNLHETSDKEIIDLSPDDFRTTVDGHVQRHWLDQFFSNGGDSTHLYFDLNEDSVVFDVGSYEGDYYNQLMLRNKHTLRIHAFEPVQSFYRYSSEHLPDSVTLHNFALGDSNSTFEISVDGNSSSQFTSGSKETCSKVRFRDFVIENNIDDISLIKINIEGGEYELLNEIIDSKFINKVDRILVQFHYLAVNPISDRAKIIERLKETHELVFSYPFVWECWKRK